MIGGRGRQEQLDLNRTRLECKVHNGQRQTATHWIWIEPDWNVKRCLQQIYVIYLLDLNRTRLECKVDEIRRTHWTVNDLNRTRLECKVVLIVLRCGITHNLNRTRLECKGITLNYNIGCVCIWIEPDWNVK